VTNTSPANPNRVDWHGAAVTYGDWRDRLVLRPEPDPLYLKGYRHFEPIPLGEGLMLSAQNSPYHYCSGMKFPAAAFDPVALVDFEVAFFIEGGDGLLEAGEFPPLDLLLAEAGIEWNGDTVIGWVPAEAIGLLLQLFREMAGRCSCGDSHEEVDQDA